MIRFLEKLERKGSQLTECDGASLNLSDITERDLRHYYESLYEQCVNELWENSLELQGDQISLAQID